MYNNATLQSMSRKRGSVLIAMLIYTGVAMSATIAFVKWAQTTLIASSRLYHYEVAYHIAEAGIEYYRWHLAHSPTDYNDGTNSTGDGPFTHTYEDKDGVAIGSYDLYITEPTVASPYVRIRSVGRSDEFPAIERSIVVDMAMPSLVQFAIASNSDVRIGEGTEVIGPLHSNAGIRFDGLARNIVSSSLQTYDDPDHGGANEWSVHTHVGTGDTAYPNDPTDPTEDHPEVFTSGRMFQRPAIDFNAITVDLASIKTQAQEDGYYYPPSNNQGWHLVFKTNGTMDVYTVTSQMSTPQGCPNYGNSPHQSMWGMWSITGETLYENTPIPPTNVIFFEDNVWVDGQIPAGTRVTIAAARLPDIPSSRRNIIVNRDLLYSSYASDATDVIGLIAQNNVIVGFDAENDLRIDAAMIAQQGKIGRFYHSNGCGVQYVRNSITSYGAIISNQRYGFAYTDGTGYQTRVIEYDPKLFYNPPPLFPHSSSEYAILRWEEQI